jgi:hypothetical protein
MASAFVDAAPAQIVARLEALGASAALAPVTARVGEEAFGCRNVGVDLPRARRSTDERRALVNRVRAALEAAGVVLAETAVAPRVRGDVVGNVRVREVEPSWGDGARLATPARRKALRPFPAREIRDALGLVRLLYLARKVSGHLPPPSSDPLVVIGTELRAALAYANEPEGAPAYRAGVARALAALQRLEAAISLRDDAGDAARAGEARLSGREIRKGGKGGR